jgi:uncharacterized protein (DUF58 family)
MLTTGQASAYLDADVVSRLAGVPLFARRPMHGTVSGRHASPHRGSSVEFAEYRKYVPGDDLRRLDWRAFGRSDRFYVKEFEADTNLRCCFVLDTSGSMGFGSSGVTKFDFARRIVATLGYLASQQGDAVGLACVAKKIVQQLPPRRNAAHLRLVLGMLEDAQPQSETQLAPILHELAETIRQRALVIIVSDLFIDPDILNGCFQHLRFCRHDVAVFHLLDPLELDFNFRRPMRFLDMEGGPSIFAEPNEIADRYHRALEQYLDQLKAVVLESAVDYHRVRIDEGYEPALMRFLINRAQTKSVR